MKADENDYLDKIGPDLLRDLKLIRDVHKADTIEDAAAQAIAAHAHCLRENVLVVERPALNALMASYAATVLSEHLHCHIEAVPLGPGRGFEYRETDETLAPPTTH